VLGLSCPLVQFKSRPRAPVTSPLYLCRSPPSQAHNTNLPLFDRSNDAFRETVCAPQRQAVMNQVSGTTCTKVVFLPTLPANSIRIDALYPRLQHMFISSTRPPLLSRPPCICDTEHP
jgi:hypothetical protein